MQKVNSHEIEAFRKDFIDLLEKYGLSTVKVDSIAIESEPIRVEGHSVLDNGIIKEKMFYTRAFALKWETIKPVTK